MSTYRCAGLLILLAVLATLPFRASSQEQRGRAVRPAKIERLQNLEVDAAGSYRPAYLPREWGQLVSVQNTGPASYVAFLAAENGDIYIVRFTQRGAYLYLDTSDQGGVVTVLRREP